MVSPAMVTTFPTSAFLFANVAVAPEVESTTVSLASLPTSAAEPSTSCEVALVVASYVRLFAVMPETVRTLPVMSAVVVGWVSV